MSDTSMILSIISLVFSSSTPVILTIGGSIIGLTYYFIRNVRTVSGPGGVRLDMRENPIENPPNLNNITREYEVQNSVHV
jgi:hypothetical protein